VGIVLPGALAWVLDMIGIEWPNIDEDELRSGATQLRTLAGEVDGNTGDAKSSIEQMLQTNSSQSLDLFNALWGKLADGHLPQLSKGLGLIATGLDASAVLVEGMKVGAVVQLGILAGEIIADQAAAPFTFGASELAIPGEVEITSQIVKAAFKAVANQVEQALLNAIEGPIFSALGSAGDELAEQLVGDALGTNSGVNVGAVFSAGEKGLADGVNGEVSDPGSILGIPDSGGSNPAPDQNPQLADARVGTVDPNGTKVGEVPADGTKVDTFQPRGLEVGTVQPNGVKVDEVPLEGTKVGTVEPQGFKVGEVAN
jgi:hypothetical protein